MAVNSLAMKRIMKDIANVQTNAADFASHGIYYKSCDANIRTGTAMLIGQSGTPYYGGFYFFDITFPDEYPFSPIRVKSLTQDGRTRFNPNMYIEGKVCLSILNTWSDGPQWTSIQNLGSVLIAIMSAVLNENPLENEPAYTNCGKSPAALAYNRLVLSANFYTAITYQLTRMPSYAAPFADIMWSEFETRLPTLLTICSAHLEFDGRMERCAAFGMVGIYNFAEALAGLKKLVRPAAPKETESIDIGTL